MNKNFLDYTGLAKYTEKIEELVDEKVAGLVPQARKVNAKALTEDINLTAYDVDAVPITRQINGHQLGFDLNLTAADLNAVPTSRTVNGKPLSEDITLSTSDIAGLTTPDLSGYVPTSRTVNGKALTSNITLSASDVSAHPSSWTPTASDVGALPITGGTLTGDLTIKGSDNYGTKINLGDNDYVHISEPEDDCMEIKAKKVNFVLSDTTDSKFTVNGSSPFGSSGVGQSMAGKSVKPTSSTTVTAATGAEIFNDYRDRVYSGTKMSGGNIASGLYSHAEGTGTTAKGLYSHAEGITTQALHTSDHAEGSYTEASGESSHAEGYYTTASSFASHASGKLNKAMTDNEQSYSTVGDVFVVGNGTSETALSNALRLAYEGTLYLTKAYNSTGADYAEYFEWLDGNPDNEDRVGRFVTLEGDKITLANDGDYILGVVSGQPCIIGNGDEDWIGRWEHDAFNRFVKEYLVETEVEVTPPSDVLNAENPDEALNQWLNSNDITKRDGKYFKMEAEVVDYPTASWRHKANPAYDPSQPYIERKDRQEWDAVGMVGVLSVLDDGTCLPNSYCKVSVNGIATNASSYIPRQTFRVIQRVSNNIIKVLLL